jgi:hypothetical protein
MHHEQRAGHHRHDVGLGVFIGDEAGVAAEHEHRAVREVEHAERAVDDGEARADEREQRPQHQAVEHLRNEIDPIDHEYTRPSGSPRRLTRSSPAAALGGGREFRVQTQHSP